MLAGDAIGQNAQPLSTGPSVTEPNITRPATLVEGQTWKYRITALHLRQIQKSQSQCKGGFIGVVTSLGINLNMVGGALTVTVDLSKTLPSVQLDGYSLLHGIHPIINLVMTRVVTLGTGSLIENELYTFGFTDKCSFPLNKIHEHVRVRLDGRLTEQSIDGTLIIQQEPSDKKSKQGVVYCPLAFLVTGKRIMPSKTAPPSTIPTVATIQP
jgi:hypothetical protein